MFGVGMPEMAVIIVVALLVLGPKRLPEVARSLGKGLAEFRRVTGEVNREFESARSMIEDEARQHERDRRTREKLAEQAERKKAKGDDADAPAPDETSASTTDAPASAETATEGTAAAGAEGVALSVSEAAQRASAKAPES